MHRQGQGAPAVLRGQRRHHDRALPPVDRSPPTLWRCLAIEALLGNVSTVSSPTDAAYRGHNGPPLTPARASLPRRHCRPETSASPTTSSAFKCRASAGPVSSNPPEISVLHGRHRSAAVHRSQSGGRHAIIPSATLIISLTSFAVPVIANIGDVVVEIDDA
jgi:hypothetical protein